MPKSIAAFVSFAVAIAKLVMFVSGGADSALKPYLDEVHKALDNLVTAPVEPTPAPPAPPAA